MRTFWERLRRNMFRPAPRRHLPQRPRYARPLLEGLENRIVPDAMLFTGGGGTTDWNTADNWADQTNPNLPPHVPNASDDVGIPVGMAVTISGAPGTKDEVNSIVTQGGSSLSVANGTKLQIDFNPPSTGPAGFPLSPVDDANYFGGTVIDAGLIDAHTSQVLNGTNVIFAGSTTIGPANAEDNLVSDSAATIRFTGGGGTDVFLVGASIGIGAGTIYIDTPVALDGTLKDGTATLTLETGGTLGGAGSLDVLNLFDWTGGTLTPNSGVTIEASATFTVSGSANKSLGTALNTDTLTASLGGTGTLMLMGPAGGAPGGSITNVQDTLDISLPLIMGMNGSGGITNDGTFDGQAPASTPTVIAVPFLNDGGSILSVDNGAALTLTAPLGTSDTLNGTLELNGTLTLLGNVESTAGFSLTAGNGVLLLGNGSTAGMLTLDSGTIPTLNGTLEVSSTGTLTGAGQLNNSGTLQLDIGSRTTGLGSYQQSVMGTLVIEAAAIDVYSALTVTGLAQLSGNLQLKTVNGFTPAPGDTFTVVTAGSIEAQFDSLPPNTTATYGSSSVTLTQH